MKKLILLALLVTSTSFAQKFQWSETSTTIENEADYKIENYFYGRLFKLKTKYNQETFNKDVLVYILDPRDDFESEVINSTVPVLVDFWAEWCGPCKALTPVLEEIAGELNEKASIVKVNVDKNGDLAQKYGIRGIPTLIFFKDGEVKNTLDGAQQKSEILNNLNELNS